MVLVGKKKQLARAQFRMKYAGTQLSRRKTHNQLRHPQQFRGDDTRRQTFSLAEERLSGGEYGRWDGTDWQREWEDAADEAHALAREIDIIEHIDAWFDQ